MLASSVTIVHGDGSLRTDEKSLIAILGEYDLLLSRSSLTVLSLDGWRDEE